MKPSKDLYYHLLLKMGNEEEEVEMAEMIEIIKREFPSLKNPKKFSEDPIVELFTRKKWAVKSWPPLARKEFAGAIVEDHKEKEIKDYKKIRGVATALFRKISDAVEGIQRKADREMDEAEYRGFQEFQMWCDDERNIQHRLRLLTFIICKNLDRCDPSIIDVRIPNKADRVQQYQTESFIFLNGYIRETHVANVSVKEIDIGKCNAEEMKLEEQANLSQRKLQNMKEHKVQKFRDPFMERNLDLELEQICKAFDLLKYGKEMAFFLIKLLNRKQLDSLWGALSIVLARMPYEKARDVLKEKRHDLRHGEPEKLKNVCDGIVDGSGFNVHICLFLAQYMEQNAEEDLARYEAWNEYSEQYEARAAQTINEIESDHLLAILIDIPLSECANEQRPYQKIPLLHLALEQKRSTFLNNEVLQLRYSDEFLSMIL